MGCDFLAFRGLRKKESTKERKKAGNLSYKEIPNPVEGSRTTPFMTATSGQKQKLAGKR